MTLLKNREAEPRKLAEREAALSGYEAADLRRVIAELQGSLSWRITAPLRFITKPLFRALAARPAALPPGASETIPQTTPGLEPAVEHVAKGLEEFHNNTTTATGAGDDPSGPTLRTVCDWYHVNPKFAHAALEMLAGVDYDRNLRDIHEFRTRYQNLQLIQLDYALSTNLRGQSLAKQLRDWGAPVEANGTPRKSYLDVGFAYGGFLAAFAGLGYDVTGIEISERFGRLGRLNLESCGSPVNTRMGDFLSDEILPGERQFDLITCCDVIEHVMDPETCLRKICRLLKPGGAAYVAYPTKLSMPYVRADGHCHLFGLTLLDYYRARAAFIMYTGWPEYEVADTYAPEWYLNTARSAGVEAELIYDGSVPAPDVPGEIAALYAAFSEWTKSGSKKLEPLMRHEITLELAKYSARMFQAYSEHIAHNSIDQFAGKWIDPLTRILIRKPSA